MKHRSILRSPALPIMLVGLLHVLFLEAGIRYATGDDVFWHINSLTRDDYVSEAVGSAMAQGRVIFVVKILIQLFLSSVYRSRLYDVINLALFALLWLSLYAALRNWIGTRSSAVVTSFSCLLFPLHFFYTIPHGYGPSEYYGFIALFGFVASVWVYLRKPSLAALAIAVVSCAIALTGSEVNFLLLPVLTALTVIADRTEALCVKARRLIPFGIMWLVVVVAYWGFGKIYSDPRIAPRFHLWDIATTFSILIWKAFLPLGLFGGIELYGPPVQRVPGIPGNLTYASLFAAVPTLWPCAVVFGIGCLIFAAGLACAKLRPRQAVYLAIFGLLIAVIPVAVLSVSTAYQKLVPPGYLQGHIMSFLAQLGIWLVVIAGALAICSKARSRLARVLTIAPSAVGLSAMFLTTFIYDLMNREALNANMQRWAAFEFLAEYEQGRGAARPILIPDFWKPYGVSGPPQIDKYWNTYAGRALGMQMNTLNWDATNSNADYATYFPTSSGRPLVALYQISSPDQRADLVIISNAPASGTISYTTRAERNVSRRLGEWTCQRICVTRVEEAEALDPASMRFAADDRGTGNLLKQYWKLNRGGFGLWL